MFEEVVDQTYTYDYCWDTTCGVCLPTVWLYKVEGGTVVMYGCFHPKFFGIQGMGQKYIVLVWHSVTIQLGYFLSSSFMG